MIKVLTELCNVIGSLNHRDFWDYASIVVPILISVTSIGISVVTLKSSKNIGNLQNKLLQSQNNIALFEKKYKVSHIINFLLPLAKNIINSKTKNCWLPLDSAAESYISGTTLTDTISNKEDRSSFYTGLILEAGKIEFLFNDNDLNKVMIFLKSLHLYILNCYSGKECRKEINDLKKSLREIEKSDVINRFNSSIKLY